MASKPKRFSRNKQFFSELDTLINDAEAVSLDPKSSRKKQFFSELDAKAVSQDPKSSTSPSVMEKEEEEEIVPISVDSSTSLSATSARRESVATANAESPLVVNEDVILNTQLNAFVPSVFPKKDEYVAMIIREAVKSPSSISDEADSSICLQSTAHCLEHLLGPPPLEYLWKVRYYSPKLKVY